MMKYFRRIFLPVIGITFIILVVDFLDIQHLDISSLKSLYFNWKIPLCIGFYIIAHLLRSLRLFIISGDMNYSLKAVILEQFKTNGVNLIVPFKLGEAYRFIRFKEVFKSGFVSLNTLIIERFFDFAILALLFSMGLILYPNEVTEIQNTLISVMLILIVLLGIVLALEDTILIFHKRLLYRSQDSISFPLLKFSYDFLINLREAKKVLKTKSLSIISFTILVWAFELLSLFLFFGDLGHRIDLLVLLTVFIAFSSLLPNGPLGFGGVQLSFYTIFLLYNSFDNYLIASTAYTIYIFGSGLLISLILFIIYYLKNRDEKK